MASRPNVRDQLVHMPGSNQRRPDLAERGGELRAWVRIDEATRDVLSMGRDVEKEVDA
jgi:hypothetical protein